MPYLLQHRTGQDSRHSNGYDSRRSIADKSPTAYIGRLPVELLLKIFKACLPARFGFYSSLYRLPPLSLSLVCRLWRDIVRSSPFLWASFDLRHNKYEQYQWLTIRGVQRWLKRSQGSPLTLSIEARREARLDYVATVFALFLNNLSRWADVALMLTEHTCTQLLAADPRRARLLSRLEIMAYECTDQQAAMLSAFVGPLHGISNLSLIFHPVCLASVRGIPFSRLTHLNLEAQLSVEDYITTISQCAQLVELALQVVLPSESASPTTAPKGIVLPALTSFRISGDVQIGAFFPHFRFPALQDLAIESFVKNRSQDAQALFEFFNRSACQLSSFILTDKYMEETELITCLSHSALRRLRTLRVQCENVCDNTIRLLTLRDNDPNAMTCLKSLELWCASSDNICADMIQSRLRIPSASHRWLQYVFITFHLLIGQMSRPMARGYPPSVEECTQKHLEDISRLEAMETDGLKLYFYFQ